MFNTLSVWHGGIMAIVLVSGLSGPASSPGQRHCVVFLSRILYSHTTAYNPGVNWIPANLMLGVTLRWTSIPSTGRGQSKYHATETEISSSLMGPLSLMQT